MSRVRLDKLLIKRNLAKDVESAKTLLLSGKVLVDGAIQTSQSSFVDSGSSVEILKDKPKFVSRAGFKLEAALVGFNIDLKDLRCLDIGSSTGGFSDCMLQYGASEVVAVDVGKGQLDDKIRYHDRVRVFEKCNAKDLSLELIGSYCNFAAIDVSFTSILNVIDATINVLDPVEAIALIKPQFELPPKFVDSRGIVTSRNAHKDCIAILQEQLRPKLEMVQLMPSPIVGTKGNIEFLVHLLDPKVAKNMVDPSKISKAIEIAHQKNRPQ